MSIKAMNLLDTNPLEHITGDVAISQYNYESILNGLVQWDQCKSDTITIRVATKTEPYFVDYEIPTKYFYDKNYGDINSETFLATRSFAYTNRMKMAVAQGDQVTLRINVRDNGDTSWRIYKEVVVYDEYIKEATNVSNVFNIAPLQVYQHSYDPGIYLRMFDPTTTPKSLQLYKTVATINAGETINLSDITKIIPVIGYENSIPIAPQLNPYSDLVKMNTSSGYRVYEVVNGARSSEVYCELWQEGVKYAKGTVVTTIYGDYFISLVDNPGSSPVIIEDDGNHTLCTYDLESWEPVLLLSENFDTITATRSMRFTETTDCAGYVLRNLKDESNELTKISIMGSINIVGTETCQPTGLNIMSTSNYANWPMSLTTKWIAGSVYTADAGKSSYDKQDYSAVMVFDHTDADLAYKHIINYDGPDVDQGLCIMLPVSVQGDDNMMHDPQDGTMLEFLFNIWPNHAYGKADNDLIINKSQIYVYSVPQYSDYLNFGFTPETVVPIAKFSMARLVNFYVFSENIGVPDRPVCYKARFIYSKEAHNWKTYDYYQMPDHIFMSPHGFVDPTDIKAYDVESAGFPLYQNPFSSYDMSPIHVGKDFLNQIQKPGQDE